MAEGAMTAFLGNIGAFFSQSITWIGEIINVISENPLLLVLVVAMPIVGFAFGLLGRLIRL